MSHPVHYYSRLGINLKIPSGISVQCKKNLKKILSLNCIHHCLCIYIFYCLIKEKSKQWITKGYGNDSGGANKYWEWFVMVNVLEELKNRWTENFERKIRKMKQSTHLNDTLEQKSAFSEQSWPIIFLNEIVQRIFENRKWY